MSFVIVAIAVAPTKHKTNSSPSNRMMAFMVSHRSIDGILQCLTSAIRYRWLAEKVDRREWE